mgnify:CR=1 FL=1
MNEGFLLQFFGVAFLFVGVIAFGFTSRNLVRAIKSLGWPQSTGEIQKSGVKEVTVGGNTTDMGAHSAIQVNYQYSYIVNGRSYRSQRVTMSDKVVKTGRTLSSLSKQFKTGQDVRVYYNPNNPSYSVLKKGPDIYCFTVIVTPALMLALGGYMVFFSDHLLEVLT